LTALDAMFGDRDQVTWKKVGRMARGKEKCASAETQWTARAFGFNKHFATQHIECFDANLPRRPRHPGCDWRLGGLIDGDALDVRKTRG
jgi:hypothetical protein